MNVQPEREGITFPVDSYTWWVTRREVKSSNPVTITNEELEIIRTTDDNLYSFLFDRSTQDGILTTSGQDYLKSSMLVHRILRHNQKLFGVRQQLPNLSENLLDQIKDREFDAERNRPYLHHLDGNVDLDEGRFAFPRALIREMRKPLSRKFIVSLIRTYIKDAIFLFKNERVLFGVIYNSGRFADKEIHREYIRKEPLGGFDIYFAYKAYAEITEINALMDHSSDQ